MIRMLKENYDNELSRLQKKKMGVHNRSLGIEEKQECEEVAKKVVCEIGISMYQFKKTLLSRYKRTIENEAIHQAVDEGKELGFLRWGAPRRYDTGRGGEWQNIVLTEKAFEAIKDPGFNSALTMMHLSYVLKPRRR
jgi:hypothetical protein